MDNSSTTKNDFLILGLFNSRATAASYSASIPRVLNRPGTIPKARCFT